MAVQYPSAVHIETLNFCNAKCVMCPATTTGRVRGTMTDATFNRILAQILEMPERPSVTLHGTGEPLLYKKLGDRIRALTRHGITVNLTTNGALLTRMRAFDVLDAGVNSIEFSIESLDKEVFEKIRVGLDLDEVIANLLSCIELRNRLNPACTIKMIFIAHEDNKASLSKYLEFCRQNLAERDVLTLVPRHNFAHGFDSEVPATSDPCGFPISSVNIQHDGIINLCCVDSEQEHPLGDVNKNTITEIFNDAPYGAVRAAHAEGRRGSIALCASCNVPEAIKIHRSFERRGDGFAPLN